MKRILVVLMLLLAMGGFAVAEDLGLSIGAELWNSPGKDNYDNNSFGIGPFAELEKSIDIIDLYFKGQYLINLDKKKNQAFYLEEMITFNLGQAGPGSLSLTLDNYNLFATMINKKYDNNSIYAHKFYPVNDYIYIDNGDSVKKITGYFEPSASYEIEALKIMAGLPIGYSPTGSNYPAEFIDLYGGLGYSHESGFGIEARAYCNLSKEWDMGDNKSWDNLYKMMGTLSYTKKDVFKASLEVYTYKDADGKFMKICSFTPGIEVYVKNLTFYGSVEIWYFNDKEENSGDNGKGWNGWGEDKKSSIGFLVGAKVKM